MSSAAAEFRYTLGTALFEGETQAVYETEYDGRPAILKFFRPETAVDAAKLAAQLNSASRLRHSHLTRIYDSGETELFETHVVFVVMERGDDTLARGGVLSDEEKAQVHDAIQSALDFLRAQGHAHGRVKPSNILACGSVVKLSADAVHKASDGEYAADLKALEAIAPKPKPAPEPEQPAPITEPPPESDQPQTRHRQAILAVGGALMAALLCIFLLRSAQHKTPPPSTIVSAPSTATLAPATQAPAAPGPASQAPASQPPAAPAPVSATPAPVATPKVAQGIPDSAGKTGVWTIVGAAYRNQAAAQKRADSINAKQPNLHSRVAEARGGRYFVVFATGLTEQDAKKELARLRREGAPRDSYITKW